MAMHKMSASSWLLSVGVMIAVAGCQAKIDGSSDETMKRTVDSMMANLNEEEQKKLQESIMLVALEDAAGMNLFQLAANADKLLPMAKEKLDGKTFDDILKEGVRLKTARETKAREQALSEIRELELKQAKSDQATEKLAKFVVEKSRFYIKKGMFQSTPVIDLTVKNATEHAVARAYFAGTISTPGRAIPWLQERFNYEIAGGLEPGEKARWKLEPNMFSDWGKVKWKTDMVFTVTVARLDGADGESLFAAEFSKENLKRLTTLRDKYKAPLNQ